MLGVRGGLFGFVDRDFQLEGPRPGRPGKMVVHSGYVPDGPPIFDGCLEQSRFVEAQRVVFNGERSVQQVARMRLQVGGQCSR